jgi:POT family proton-dependent oligopeptide transporter
MSESSTAAEYLGTRGEDEPTEFETRNLRRVPDKIPWSAFLVAIVELCERFAFYGLSGPFQNYIANKYKDPANPGALGYGQAAATALTNAFTFWTYFTPMIGAIIADQWLGKYKAILLFSGIYLVGLAVLFVTSIPKAIEAGVAGGGLVTAMLVIGLGTGGIKSNVSPLIAEQVHDSRMRTKFLPSGEKVIIDPALTVQRVYMVFYQCINIGSLASIATTTMELKIGFWSGHLLALCAFAMGIVVLVLGRRKYIVKPPKGSVVLHALRIIGIGIKNRGTLDAAKPSVSRNMATPWTDDFVDEVKRALVACRVFLFFPIYWVTYSQASDPPGPCE